MRLQVDQEFKKNNIKEINKRFNVEMFSTKMRGGKAFAAEQKIRELEKRISKLRLIKSKSGNLHKLIKMSVNNMNKTNSVKYGLPPENIENQSFSSEKFRLGFNFDRIKEVSKVHKALDKNHKKLYSRKKKKLRADLAIGENVLLLAERIKQKSAPGKLYKSSVQNIYFF